MVQKGKNILFCTVCVYAVLVATHKGEFWPFSIYPMFSQAGRPWVRALVREVPTNSLTINWDDKTLNELSGTQFAMNNVGINQNDLASFIHKNEVWSDEKIYGLRKYFKEKFDTENFMIYRVHGAISGENADSVAVVYVPYVFLKKNTTIFNPRLFGPSK